ncbi:DUF1616 domain-containing protein [Halococcus thailandensis]|uniref:DUF1616 domain-containing protein n=1 Tax=Halococcus thailandensis JCM 13552 TaxID=1227457 RepID=M0MYW2_9EURY|nr:DUF1616 domain-containing protein [Halococcus thailandensis]EMA49590.1 hypothetical protein C451_18678 [Halococcus thailandensis JCM 13552]
MSRDSLSENTTADRYAESASALGGLPGDLLLVVAYALVGGGLLVVGLPSTLQFIVGIPLLLFVPGYTVLSALFPGRPSRNAGQVSSLSGMTRTFSSLRSIQHRGVRWGERVALSFGLSLFLVPLLALVLDFSTLLFGTDSPYHTGPIVAVLVGFAVICAAIGFVRRLGLPRDERFGVPVGYWIDDFVGGLTGSSVDALLNVVLVLSVLVGAASMTYALAVPQDGSSTTNFAVGTQDGSGEFTVGDYPPNMTVDQPQQLTVQLQNHEGEPANYSVVAQLQRYDGEEVLTRNTLERFSTQTVPENRTWQRQHTVTPNIAENDLQLVYLLYQGDPPQNPTEENAYRSVHLSVNVSGGGGAGSGGTGAGGGGAGGGNGSA